MKYPSIRIEGSILSPDILDRIEDLPGQKPSDFGFDSSAKVKDEIARAWADAQDYWRIFQRKVETLRLNSPATTETRQQWMMPFFGLLGYQLEYQAKGAELNGKIYSISHRATNRANTPVHIIGYREPAGLDRKPEVANVRMSAHAVVQEFINLHDQLYALVTNGRILRLLRDSSRLIKLSYLEFDLDRIFTDNLFADFAILYRLLHVSRLPVRNDAATESLIEKYHQDSLDSGARIRDGLSRAVEQAIRDFANGFLSHPANDELRAVVASENLRPEDYYKDLLRLIYRLLFLMVIEERDLVYPASAPARERDLYNRYYSVQRLRLLSEKRYLADSRRHDLWLALLSTFRLFEAGGPGDKIGLAPLAGDLFSHNAIGSLLNCTLGNDVLLRCLRSLSLYENSETRQLIRVNYGALNVEEFGSVYEGLLEYEPAFLITSGKPEFSFKAGDERSRTGSHYTPDDLVQPLIKHSLDYLIADRLKEKNPEGALLDLRVADIACGSGHILLAAARRIATELAVVRTGEEQPSPSAYRAALRDVIRTCIYGVDLNPLAVELCKVALWLEAHNPGQPLNFLDHHIKCGNAIVGFVRKEDVDKGVPDEAFATMPGDDKDIAAKWRKINKKERRDHAVGQLHLAPAVQRRLDGLFTEWTRLSALPERTPEQIDDKKAQFERYAESAEAFLLSQVVSIPVAQFYTPKTREHDAVLVSDATFRRFWNDGLPTQGQGPANAWATAFQKRFFHWFLEFPDIVARGGFDCILGNPPYLGGRNVTLRYGFPFSGWLRIAFPSFMGNSDLVAAFLLRAFTLLRDDGYLAFLTTNSIAQGETRAAGMEVVLRGHGHLAFAVPTLKWPGRAAVDIAQFSLSKGRLSVAPVLGARVVATINSYFEADTAEQNPFVLIDNSSIAFKGSEPSEALMLDSETAHSFINADITNADVVKPYLNGDDFYSSPTQSPSRYVIDFGSRTEAAARSYALPFSHAESHAKVVWQQSTDHSGTRNWWWHRRRSAQLYATLEREGRGFAVGFTSKTGKFDFVSSGIVFSNLLVVVCDSRIEIFAVLSSIIHEAWAWKYGSQMETGRLRYTPSSVFQTFPFPSLLQSFEEPELARVATCLRKHRAAALRALMLGLTGIYNLFHDRNLTSEKVAKVSKKPMDEAERGYQGLLELRRLHRELDIAVRDAYGWTDLDLGHDFHEVETLPENDRLRYTISATARKEVLRRLLLLNHERAAAEAASKEKKPKRGKKRTQPSSATLEMFPAE